MSTRHTWIRLACGLALIVAMTLGCGAPGTDALAGWVRGLPRGTIWLAVGPESNVTDVLRRGRTGWRYELGCLNGNSGMTALVLGDPTTGSVPLAVRFDSGAGSAVDVRGFGTCDMSVWASLVRTRALESIQLLMEGQRVAGALLVLRREPTRGLEPLRVLPPASARGPALDALAIRPDRTTVLLVNEWQINGLFTAVTAVARAGGSATDAAALRTAIEAAGCESAVARPIAPVIAYRDGGRAQFSALRPMTHHSDAWISCLQASLDPAVVAGPVALGHEISAPPAASRDPLDWIATGDEQWTLGQHARDARVSVTELVTAGETVHDWSRLITFTASRGGRDVYERVMTDYLMPEQPCNRASLIGGQDGDSLIMAVFGCGTRPETLLIRVSRVRDVVLTVQYAERDDHMEPARAREWAERLLLADIEGVAGLVSGPELYPAGTDSSRVGRLSP